MEWKIEFNQFKFKYIYSFFRGFKCLQRRSFVTSKDCQKPRLTRSKKWLSNYQEWVYSLNNETLIVIKCYIYIYVFYFVDARMEGFWQLWNMQTKEKCAFEFQQAVRNWSKNLLNILFLIQQNEIPILNVFYKIIILISASLR